MVSLPRRDSKKSSLDLPDTEPHGQDSFVPLEEGKAFENERAARKAIPVEVRIVPKSSNSARGDTVGEERQRSIEYDAFAELDGDILYLY